MRFYTYLYYKFVRWSTKIDRPAPHKIHAVMMLSFVVIMLYLGPFVVLIHYMGFDLRHGAVKPIAIGISCAIIALNYWYFVHKKNSDRILNEFAAEKPKTERLGTLVTVALVVFAPLISIIIIILGVRPL